ncbi:MAG: AMP-binding protein [Candidatus Omnitrophica bacterium]|nr:AMP-binding protein [Candidatus Omnitrophota bacterium]
MQKIDLKNLTIIELMVAINRRYSDIRALQIKRGKEFIGVSYIELGRRTSDTAYNLKKLGVEKGNRVAILSENRPEWAIAFFGIVSCAGVTVPMDIKLSDTEIEFILNDSGAKCIFVSGKFLDRIVSLKTKLKHLKNIISFEDETKEGILLLKEFKVPASEIAHREIQSDDLAIIVYTSGTTGVAKGVELTYKNLLFEIICLDDLICCNPKDKFLSILPLNHMLEITGGLLAPLYAGATIAYCESLKPTVLLSLMNETKTTVMICVPLVLKMFHNGIMRKINDLPKFKQALIKSMLKISKISLKYHVRIGKLFFSSIHKQFGGHLRCFVSDGALLDPMVESDFNALGFRILQGYGLTETSPVVAVNDFAQCKYGSVGKPLPGVEIKIITNTETGGREGEIITKGPHVMKGYYKNPDKTKEVVRDGWFYTGDIGYFDDDGFLFISGRIKNLIVLGAGKKVFPEEVEEVVSTSPYIKEICVLGRIAKEGARKGCEEVYAVIVPNLDNFDKNKSQDKQLIKEKIVSELSRLGVNLAAYKRIIDFEIWNDELPKTSTRKIKRKALLELISKKDKKESPAEKKEFIEAQEVIEDDLTLKLRKIFSETTKLAVDKIKLHSNLYNDLGVDSLMKVEVLSAIDKECTVSIPDEIAYEINTFSDMVSFVKEYKKGRTDDVSIKEDEIADIIKSNLILKLTRFVSYSLIKLFAKLYLRLKVQGLKNIPEDKSFIIAANHVSLLDFPIIFCSLPYFKTKDMVAPAAKDYFYAKSLKKNLIGLAFNTFPFERMGNFVRGLRVCSKLLENNKSIMLFPEGTRSISGALQPFKPGIGSLSWELGVPIVPTYIAGAYEALPKSAIFPRPKVVRIYFGKPVYPDAYRKLGKEKTNYEIYTLISKDVEEAVKKLAAKE